MDGPVSDLVGLNRDGLETRYPRPDHIYVQSELGFEMQSDLKLQFQALGQVYALNEPNYYQPTEAEEELNRYSNIVPYVNNMLFLGPLGRFISASPLRLKDQKEYLLIASQHPLAAGIADFWQLLDQQKVECIVQLNKFDMTHPSYLPTALDPLQLKTEVGNLKVVLKESVTTQGLTVSQLQLQTKGVVRAVRHVHFREWPDHGVFVKKDYPTVRDMRRMMQGYYIEGKRVLVHCSAGVGRTGTVLGLLGVSLLKKPPMEVIWNLRMQRVGMVNTFQQYKLLFEPELLS